MPVRALSPAIQTLFAELQQQLETAPPAGSIYRRSMPGGDYVYAKVAVGSTRLDQFIGRSGDSEVEAKAAALQLGTKLAAERRQLVALLRRDRLASPDRRMGAIIDALAHAGLFRAGAVLVGTAAYMACEPLVGARLPSPTLMTADVDLAAASVTIAAQPPEKLETILRRADPTFDGLPQLDPKAPPSRFRSNSGFLVDVLTPTRTRDDPHPVALDHLGAGAAPLQHLAWLIDGAVPAAVLWGAGVLVAVPQPARFAVHKLILAQRRDAGSRPKRAKDLAQARALIEALQAHDPFALEDALAEAQAKGDKGWRAPIARSLRELGITDLAG